MQENNAKVEKKDYGSLCKQLLRLSRNEFNLMKSNLFDNWKLKNYVLKFHENLIFKRYYIDDHRSKQNVWNGNIVFELWILEVCFVYK